MIYVTGIHALNLPCHLDTCGDWHTSALKWENISFADTAKSVFGDYGIEDGHTIPFHEGYYHVANHIRACLDLLEQGKFAQAQGMRRDFICNEKYTMEIFHMVKKLDHAENWSDINRFMEKEYLLLWKNFAGENTTEAVKPLKVEMSFRSKLIKPEEACDINRICQMKCSAYNAHDELCDLYDIVDIYRKFKDELSSASIDAIIDAFSYKGRDHVDYLLSDQTDDLIDKEKFTKDFLDVYNDLGFISDDLIETED